jgi:hypothetical protein
VGRRRGGGTGDGRRCSIAEGRMVGNDKLLRHKGEGEDGEERLGPKLDDLPAALTVRGGDAATEAQNSATGIEL